MLDILELEVGGETPESVTKSLKGQWISVSWNRDNDIGVCFDPGLVTGVTKDGVVTVSYAEYPSSVKLSIDNYLEGGDATPSQQYQWRMLRPAPGSGLSKKKRKEKLEQLQKKHAAKQ